jgi:hypothetical protein
LTRFLLLTLILTTACHVRVRDGAPRRHRWFWHRRVAVTATELPTAAGDTMTASSLATEPTTTP